MRRKTARSDTQAPSAPFVWSTARPQSIACRRVASPRASFDTKRDPTVPQASADAESALWRGDDAGELVAPAGRGDVASASQGRPQPHAHPALARGARERAAAHHRAAGRSDADDDVADGPSQRGQHEAQTTDFDSAPADAVSPAA